MSTKIPTDYSDADWNPYPHTFHDFIWSHLLSSDDWLQWTANGMNAVQNRPIILL